MSKNNIKIIDILSIESINPEKLVITDISNVPFVSLSWNTTSINFETVFQDHLLDLNIDNINKIVYQKHNNGIKRKGFRNLKRLKIDKSKNYYEWLISITPCKDTFIGTPGFEFKFKSGSLLKILGDDLFINFKSGPKLENNQYTPPEDETVSKIQFFLGNISKKITEIKEKVEETILKPSEIDKIEDKEILDEGHLKNQETPDDLIVPIDIDKVDLLHSSQSELVTNIQAEVIEIDNVTSELAEDVITVKTKKKKKPKKSLKNPLAYVNGITKNNRENIMNAGFDSVERIANATVSQLIKIHGVGKSTAKKMITSAKELKNK